MYRSQSKGELIDEVKFDRYKPPEHLKNNIRKLHEQDNWHGPLAALEDWLIIYLAIGFGEYFSTRFGPIISVLPYLISVIVIGARHRALATLLHESSHGIIARNKKLNYFLGTVLGGWAVGQSWSVYHRSHVVFHHAHLGNKEKDPDYMAMIATGLYGKEMSRRGVRSYLFGIFSPRQTLAYAKYLLSNRIWSKYENFNEFLARMFYYLLISLLLTISGTWWLFIKYWMVPMLTTANWIGSLIEMAEHYPLIEVKPENNELYMSRNRLNISRFTYFFLGMHEESWHLVHHLFPKMPFYHQAEAHTLLLQDPLYASVQRTSGWWGIFQEMENLAENKIYPWKSDGFAVNHN